MLDWLGNLDDKEMVIGTVTIYQLWLARNDVWEEAKMAGPQDIAKRLISAPASKPAFGYWGMWGLPFLTLLTDPERAEL
jgi:hypothetical protein